MGMPGGAAFQECLGIWDNLYMGSCHNILQKHFSKCWQSWSDVISLHLRFRLQLGLLGVTHREIQWLGPAVLCMEENGNLYSGKS